MPGEYSYTKGTMRIGKEGILTQNPWISRARRRTESSRRTGYLKRQQRKQRRGIGFRKSLQCMKRSAPASGPSMAFFGSRILGVNRMAFAQFSNFGWN